MGVVLWFSEKLVVFSAAAVYSAGLVLAVGFGTSGLTLGLLLVFSAPTYSGLRQAGFATIAEETEGGGSMQIAWGRIDPLRDEAGDGTAVAAYSRPASAQVEANGKGRPLQLAAVSSGFYSVFTAPLTAGRDFTRVEEGASGSRAVIVSDGLPLSERAESLFTSLSTSSMRLDRAEHSTESNNESDVYERRKSPTLIREKTGRGSSQSEH